MESLLVQTSTGTVPNHTISSSFSVSHRQYYGISRATDHNKNVVKALLSSQHKNKMGAYYKDMIRTNPTNSLFLGNYAKYLHQVEKDLVKAEEYYGRAILASPHGGDGEVLSQYGKLIWESDRDESRADSYFHQALHASPNDCTVLGSYAHFLWEAEEEQNGSED